MHCARLAGLLLIAVFWTHSASAQHIRDWQIRDFISGKVLQGLTVKDRERWSVAFDSEGSFKLTYTNGRIQRGTWTVEGAQLHLLFAQGKGSTCRLLFLNAEQIIEWQDCGTGVASSTIVSPTYDRAALDGANQRRADDARQAQQIFGNIAGSMPGNNRVGNIVAGAIDSYLDANIARLLSPEGQRLHAEATRQAWVTGNPQVWTNPQSNERGRIQMGERSVGADGVVRQREKSEVYANGQVHEVERDICFGPDGAKPCG